MSYWIVTLGNLYFVGETMRNYGEMDLLFTANKEIALPLETKNDAIKRSQEFKGDILEIKGDYWDAFNRHQKYISKSVKVDY
ncbi:hypothetical protein [Bacillus cereus]|uniref:hypothetical protein n=1 Tax=Bacillus cereus TaxID=1396 RepID=UPI0035CBBDB3